MRLLFGITFPTTETMADIDAQKHATAQWLHKFQVAFPELQISVLTVNQEGPAAPGFSHSNFGCGQFKSTTFPAVVRDVGHDCATKTLQMAAMFNGGTDHLSKLTRRQQGVISLMFKGYSYQQIGEELGISFCTVRAHLHAIYKRLQVKSRPQAMAKFLHQRPV
jgi:DNA-binding CsgD family transcriptional regulator